MNYLAAEMRGNFDTTLQDLGYAISINKEIAISSCVSTLKSMLFTFKSNIALSQDVFNTPDENRLVNIFADLQRINDDAYKYIINVSDDFATEIETHSEHDPLFVRLYIDDLVRYIGSSSGL